MTEIENDFMYIISNEHIAPNMLDSDTYTVL